MKITVLGAISVIAVVAIVIAILTVINNNNQPEKDTGSDGLLNL